MMRPLFSLPLILLLALTIFPQKAPEVLATAGGRNFTVDELPVNVLRIRENETASLAEARKHALADLVTDHLLEAEATAQKTTVEKMMDGVKAKVPAPTRAEIEAVYNANRGSLDGKTLEEVRPQIIQYLRREPEGKAIQSFLDSLQTKYNVKFGRDVNSPDLKPFEMIVSMTGKSVSAQEFAVAASRDETAVREQIYDIVKEALDSLIIDSLVVVEAKATGMDAGEFLAREVSNKMKDYTEEEREMLMDAVKVKLFAKYPVKYALKEPPVTVQDISVDDDPVQGNTAAPVTVVMFSDFQCSACAGTHPRLKKLLAGYGDKVRLVVRDYPLTSIHQNAFEAALAANAARAQGKFFEYIDILYRNQNALDTASLKKYAADLGLNTKQFELDLASEKNAAEVRKDMEDGKKYGVSGTPTIFVNGVKVRGLSTGAFRSAIDRALKK